MKRLFTITLLFFFVSICNAQLSRHYWIEDLGVNYTLASKTGQNGFVLAATTQDTTGSFSSGRFTKSGIIIMKLRQNYSIESAKIFKYTSGDSAYNYDFEIYDVYAHGAYYFICRKMNSGTDSGIVHSGYATQRHDLILRQYFIIHTFHICIKYQLLCLWHNIYPCRSRT